MTLRCVSRYKSNLGSFNAGDVINGWTQDQEEALLRDSPGSFVVETETKADAESVAIVEEAEAVVVTAVEDAPDHRAVTRKRRSGGDE